MLSFFQDKLAWEDPRANRGYVRIGRERVTQSADANEIAALRAGDGGVGAVCSFVGTVRDRSDGSAVSAMELEHYPGMTEKAIEQMMDEAFRRFDIRAARVAAVDHAAREWAADYAGA